MKTKEELLKIYSAYLPYELQFQSFNIFQGNPFFTLGLQNNAKRSIAPLDWILAEGENFKPVLWSMEMLTKEIELKLNGEIYGEKISIIDYLNIAKSDQYTYHPRLNCLRLNSYGKGYIQWNFNVNGALELSYRIFSLLLENHFNVFGLSDSEYIKKENLNK